MKILLLGATGRTGRLVLQKALNQGHQVNCLARNTSRIKAQQGLKIFEGNPTQREDLKKAMFNCDAVISVLNISRNSDIPWASLRTPRDFLSKVMKCIVVVAEQLKVNRITLCSAWGVAETKHDLPNWFRWLIDYSNIGVAYADHERQEQLLKDSSLQWTIVRPVGLTNNKRMESIREFMEGHPKPNLLISRASVANFLIHTLSRKELVHKKVVIST